MSAIDATASYLEQLLDDEDVHANIRRSVIRARQAYGATKRRGPAKAVGDRRVRDRVTESAVAARDTVISARRGREKQLRRERHRARCRRVSAALMLAAAAVVATDEGVRKQVLGRLGAVKATAPDGAVRSMDRPQNQEGA